MASALYYHDDIFLIPSSKDVEDMIGVNVMQLRESLKTMGDMADIILLDSAPSLGREALSVLMASDEIIFVTTPLSSAVQDVVRCLSVIEKFDVKKLGIILNMVRKGKYELSRDEVEKITGLHVLAEVPFDYNVLHAGSKNKPIVRYDQESSASIEYRKLASKLYGLEFFPVPAKKKSGFLKKFNIFRKRESVAILSPEEAFEPSPFNVKTDADKILDLVRKENIIEVNQVAGRLNIKKDSVVAWSKLLEEKGLVEYQKSFFGEKLRLKNG